MSKRWTMIVMGLIVAMAGSLQAGDIQPAPAAAAPAAAEKPFKLTSANDPTKPVPGGVRWFGREHAKCVDMTRNKKFNLCLLGDSITAMWPGDMFGTYFGKYTPANFGIGGDRCENVLWRLQNGELVGTSPKLIMLLIGTNNQGMNTAEEVAYGVTTVVKRLREICPQSKILLLGIFPSAGTPYEKTKAINAITAKLDDGKMIRYFDPGAVMLEKDGKMLQGVLSDAVHLTRKGYTIWGETSAPIIAEMMAQ
jgi:lysophospholipase L1-like esterase